MSKIAIIGSGISGMGAAWALRNTADITVFEAEARPGGHAHTMDIDYDGRNIAVDVGFIVYNGDNYPNLTGLFDTLGVETQVSDMSFAVSNPDGFEWASTLTGMFAHKRNFFRPRFHRFWRTILKFNDLARQQLESGEVGDVGLGYWLKKNGFDEDFRENYILPMGAAIWSTPEKALLDYPAISFFRFFENHRLMHRERPAWRTVTGGSRSYVEKIAADLGDRLRLSAPVASVAPHGDQIKVTLQSSEVDYFDDVILATHSDISRSLLDPSYEDPRFLLGSARYRTNQIYVHRDPALMPGRRAAWASWNVLKQNGDDICLTYWMNLLQKLPDDCPLFVTLNPDTPPAPELTFTSFSCDHPQFDGAAEAAVRVLKRHLGENGIWLAGAWMGSGFHEDGLKAGLSAGLSLGGKVEWVPEGVDIVEPARTTHADSQQQRLASN